MKRMLLIMIIAVSALMANDFFVLCEGNFGSSNASLWEYDGNEMQGPVLWNLESNLLGDVGQSLCFHENKLFVVVNNSHRLEVIDTKTDEKIASIDLPFSSPRYFAVNGLKGYLSCWGVGGILVIDLNSYTVTDTISVGALPEDIIINNEILYTSINMNSMWQSEDNVYAYDLTGDVPTLVDTFEVVAGPGKMTLKGDELYIASTYYDASWSTYAGMSKINLLTKEVTSVDYGVNFSFSGDLVEFNNEIYRAYLNGMVKISSDCNYDDSEVFGNLDGNVYSIDINDGKVYMAYTDYMAPDTVVVLDNEANVLNTFQVGAIPGAFAFISGLTSVDDTPVLAETFQLNQNYPNPFNPSTNISYSLPRNSDVKLSIYNMLGEHIVDLVNNNQAAGLQNITWNAMDNNGNQVPTGVYFYQLKAGDVSITKKMVFMK